MGDAAKPYFVKRAKDRGTIDDEDFRRGHPQQDYLIMDDYAKGHSSKMEKGLPKKKITPGNYGSTPRKGPYAVSSNPYAFKNPIYSQPAWINDNHKDQSKRWLSDELAGNSDSRREYKPGPRIPVINRPRKDSFQESEDGYRWQDTRGCRTVRRLLHKDLTSLETMSEMEAGSPENKKQRSRPRKPRRTRNEENEQDGDLEGPVIDESVLSSKELLGLQQAEERLKRDFIDRLKRRPRNYPTAKYTCKLCDVLIESIAFAHKHIKEKRHKKNIKEKQEEELLTTLPPPTPSQINAIGIAIDKVVQEFGLHNENLEQRLEIKRIMGNVFQHKLPDCSLRLYGSSCSRLGFKNSDVNIDIQFPAIMSQPDVLLLVQECLKNSDSFIDVDADFHARVPVVVCREKQSGLLCKVSAGNENACLTTNHLTALGKLESKLIPLVIAFRHWAKLCSIDRPEEGGLPPYVFALMAIFFLQQRKEPLLPVYLGSWIEGFSLNKLGNFNLKDVQNDTVFWEYTESATGDADTAKEGAPKEMPVNRGQVSLIFDFKHLPSVPVGQLWVEMLRFYALEFNLADLVISIRVKESVSRESKDWPKKRIAIEDPYSVKRNVARTLNNQPVFEYILHCLRTTYKYFALPHKITKSSLPKPLTTVTCLSEHSKEVAEHDPGTQTKEDKLKNSVLAQEPGAAISTTDTCTVQPLTLVKETAESFGRPPSEELGNGHVSVRLENPDRIKAGASCDEQGDIKGHQETGSETRREGKHPLTADDQGLRSSRRGEFVICGSTQNNETESTLHLEGFQNPAAKECDGFITSEDKADVDEEGIEGTDDLEDALSHFTPSRQGHTSGIIHSDEEEEEEEEEDDDEEPRLSITQREDEDDLANEDELENTYTGSGDEDALSEEEDELGESAKCKDSKEGGKPAAGALLTEFNKICLKEENTCEEGSTVDQSDFFYEFSKLTFTKGKSPMVVCSLCKREGHLKKDCPEDFKRIQLEPLPPLTPKFSNILDQVCIQCYKDFSPTILEDQAREHIRQNLESFIRQEFPGTKLSLFGSSKNGFGFKQSDLDVCMTINGLETAEGLDCVRTIEELARVLKKHSGLRNILPITTAKVPIVKFFHLRSGLEVDISLYNTLALHNTRLLSAYSAIDPRVKYLCYTMKVFTKMCDIGDASRGSLSSYAYTLMVLYFLQQRNPPVIPVLQEIYKGEKKPEIFVDGWNIYFFDQIDELPTYWPEYGKNTESVGQLWLGLLRFYTEEFDFKEHVISIRRKSLLTTFKKQWTSKYIVIEDPFDLNHNLGAGLSRKMTNFIMKAFINGRRVFGIPVKGFPKDCPSKMEYFFDPEVLTEGELAPNDRCCRICGKIGHFMKDCPMRRKVRRRRDQEDTLNQRYPENKEKRSKEDKEIQNKYTEREVSTKEDKPMQCTPQKAKPVRAAVDLGREKILRPPVEKWKRQDDKDLREKRCFICGREGHIKKECPQFKGSPGVSKSDCVFGSPSSPSPLRPTGTFAQAVLLHEDKKKQKTTIFLSPQSGSLSSKYMTQGKASAKRTQQES
ncbi:terminal uridylyltransferase 7 isoform X1 [Lutra lutra]|uniref:terminal uridylyltransferase 7 isoform X1 n=2 Tax=Lutra lutra TaxID=9657 RepID=UPI001FD1E892|nr:terminal uridylyltransferase 7 isoform X1 [Lutra lutra]XP_047554899.1 terminal uridylyltransferase 7 isoform X1 [Lutra lutra]XP_047554900.1 terminal uridylyltransferase 7 isoform X1 [Lutra lutra]XP_047554901.1 terminal uridylyltransferase 7 isoform X1 [Lutra lutra]XP_047554907.1 terminal uridylyltransferase 7 isoform X1 [Lutra lutra]